MRDIEEIEKRRHSLVSETTESLYNAADRLLRGSETCSFACDSLLFGALVKQIRDLGLHWPKGSAPPPDFSPSELFQAVRNFKSPGVCDSFDMNDRVSFRVKYYNSYNYNQGCSRHSCKLGKFLGQITDMEVNDTQTKHRGESSRLTQEI